MANPNPKHKWEKGESGNPKGRLPLPADLQAIKKITPSYVKAIIAKVSKMDPSELISWCETPRHLGGPNNMELMVASIVRKAVVDGDHTKLNFLLDRTIGKVVEERHVRLEPVVYKTSIRGDGALVQEVIAEALGETDKVEE